MKQSTLTSGHLSQTLNNFSSLTNFGLAPVSRVVEGTGAEYLTGQVGRTDSCLGTGLVVQRIANAIVETVVLVSWLARIAKRERLCRRLIVINVRWLQVQRLVALDQ